jgi:hypothetical protein
MRCGKLAVFFLGMVTAAFGQVDGVSLRAQFGAPLRREVFTVRPGIEMIVDYSPTGNHACRLELPGQAPMPKDAPMGVGINVMKPIDELLAEIVPLAMRGKEGGKMCASTGLNGICSLDYEHLSIVESLRGGERTAVTVRFKMAGCSGDR